MEQNDNNINQNSSEELDFFARYELMKQQLQDSENEQHDVSEQQSPDVDLSSLSFFERYGLQRGQLISEPNSSPEPVNVELGTFAELEDILHEDSKPKPKSEPKSKPESEAESGSEPEPVPEPIPEPVPAVEPVPEPVKVRSNESKFKFTQRNRNPFPKEKKQKENYKAEIESDKPKKQKSRINIRNILIVAIPAVAAVIAVAIVLFITQKASTFVLNGDAYQNYAGIVKEIPAETEFLHNDDGSASIRHNGITEKISNIPVYFKNRKAILMPKDSLYYTARTGVMKRLDYFSEVALSQNSGVSTIRGEHTVSLGNGFVYDGGDIYVFMEPMILQYNGYEIELSPMSYVEVLFGQQIIALDYETGKVYLDTPRTDVVLTHKTGDYSVSALYDLLTLSDGSELLLFARPDLAPSVYDGK